MRLTGGIARGRRVTAPDGLEVRPTASKVRQAIFNILGNNLAGCTFLDLCAGSGLMGMEALSRGAESVTFVEENRRMARIIEQNLEFLGFAGEVIRGDFRKVAPSLLPGAFDIVFIDPPYSSAVVEEAAKLVFELGLPAKDGMVILEHSTTGTRPAEPPHGTKLARRNFYGQTVISFYEFESD